MEIKQRAPKSSAKEEIERENSQHFELNEMKAHHTKTYGMQIKSCLEGNLKL